MKQKVAILGHQFSDPCMLIKAVSRKFSASPSIDERIPPDRIIRVSVPSFLGGLLFECPVHALLDPESVYKEVASSANIVIYMVSPILDHTKIFLDDWKIYRRIREELPCDSEEILLLNDIYCGGWQGAYRGLEDVRSDMEVPHLNFFQTSIGDLPSAGSCSDGLDSVLAKIQEFLPPSRPV